MAQQQRQRFERQLRAGIRAAQQGNADQARELLEGVLRQDRNNQLGYNELAWIWLASAVKSQKERRHCLQKALEINPANRKAREAINNMVGVIGSNTSIDYADIASSAKAKMPDAPAGRQNTGRIGGGRADGGGGGNQRVFLLGGVAVVLFLLLGATIVLPRVFAPEPTPTPLPTATEVVLDAENTEEVRPTRQPSNTPSGQLVEIDRSIPSDTPSPTPPPSETPLPTATLPPLTDYNVYVVAVNNLIPSLYRGTADGTGLQRLTDNIQGVDVSQDEANIVFTQEISGAEDSPSVLQAMIAETGNASAATQVTRLTNGSVEAVALSPDGSRLAYSSTQDGDAEIFIVTLQTGVTQRLTDNTFDDTDPSWSLDGQQIIFTSDRTSLGRNDIFVHNLANSQQELVIDTSGVASSPSWSPDGSQIIYADTDRNETKIFVSSADGSLTRQMRFSDSSALRSPVWTQDGLYIAFIATYSDRLDELVIMTLDGRNEQRIVFSELPILNTVILRNQ